MTALSLPLPLARYSDFSLSVERQSRIENLCLSDVNYGDVRAVDSARAAITRMGLWDRLVDWAFHGNCKQRALEAIATIILCESAREWAAVHKTADLVGGLLNWIAVRPIASWSRCSLRRA